MPQSPRQLELVRLIQRLHPGKRHPLTVVCRGTEPWEILEHIEETRIQIPPPAEGKETAKAA